MPPSLLQFLGRQLFLAAFAASFFIATPTHAAIAPMSGASIQAAFENVRKSLSDLLIAKDERRIDEVRFRINAYQNILQYTVTDIQDLRLQLTTPTGTDNGSPEARWRTGILDGLLDATAFIVQEQVWLDSEEGILSLDGIRDRAEKFHLWRATTYAPRAEPAREFLLIERQATIVDTATRRLKKVGDDVLRLKRARVRGATNLGKQLTRVETLIHDAGGLETAARDLFALAHFTILESARASSTTSTIPLPPLPELSSSTATSSLGTPGAPAGALVGAGGTSTMPVVLPGTPKELVRESLKKIQAAYSLFLEMSNAVQLMIQ